MLAGTRARTAGAAGQARARRHDARALGPRPAAGFIAGAVFFENETALVDDLGTMTFGEIDRSSNRIAHSLAENGIVEGDGVAIMCRNHRGFVEATVAIAKLGAHALYLNTAFAGPQLTEVVKREKPKALIYDEEFTDLLAEARQAAQALHRLARGRRRRSDARGPARRGQRRATRAAREDRAASIILTSGTTGTPKGANRESPASLDPAVSLLSKIPLRSRWSTPHRRSAVPLVGLRPLHYRAAARTPRWCSRASSIPRTASREIERSRADSSSSCR